jgi:CheY-like chemotaxis protein
VLIIEDSLVLRMTITKFVADLGRDIVEATDGQEGLLAAQENRPDRIICDINMPIWTVSNLSIGCANPQRSKTPLW